MLVRYLLRQVLFLRLRPEEGYLEPLRHNIKSNRKLILAETKQISEHPVDKEAFRSAMGEIFAPETFPHPEFCKILKCMVKEKGTKEKGGKKIGLIRSDVETLPLNGISMRKSPSRIMKYDS